MADLRKVWTYGPVRKVRQGFVDRWLHRFGTGCHYCGDHMIKAKRQIGCVPKVTATIDHVVPISLGGDLMDQDNWQVICMACNGAKGSLDHREYLHKLDGTTPPILHP